MKGDRIFIDASDHVGGKLGTFVAKKLLEHNNITVVHCENLKFTGPIHRGVGRYQDFIRKRNLVNPLKGPYHYKAPSALFRRIVKRMLPVRKVKGDQALKRLIVYDGCPKELENEKFMKCPKALLEFTADTRRKSYRLGDLSKKFGWKYDDLTKKQNQEKEERLRKKSEVEEKKKQLIENFKKSKEFERRVEDLMARRS
ncbi:60S ribosomal protein L13a [Dictyocoela muelleri]|nr:60S ribosomal protein L13a [Dictyocoela muelleri]